MPRFPRTHIVPQMLILFDQGTPSPLRPFLQGHTVKKTIDLGWNRLTNGELLTEAEAAGFDLLLTTDKNIGHQQNLAGRRIAIVVLGNPRWPVLRLHVQQVVSAINAANPGCYLIVDTPSEEPK